MDIKIIISIVALICSVIIATNNVFGLRERFLQWVSSSALIREYCRLNIEKFGFVQLPLEAGSGLRKSMLLSDIFVPLPIELIQQNLHEQLSTPENKNKSKKYTSYLSKHILEKKSEDERDHQFRPIRKKFDWQQLNLGKKLIILGERGAGKSTLLKWIAYHYCLEKVGEKGNKSEFANMLPAKGWVPVYLDGKDLNFSTEPLLLLHENILNQIKTLQKPKHWVERVAKEIFHLINEEKILLLVDGIDEITDLQIRRKFCADLYTFSRTHPRIPILITTLNTIFGSISREFGEEFEIAQISSLGREDKIHFGRKWASLSVEDDLIPEFAENLQNEITGSRNLSRLTENIQLLTLIVQLYQSRGTLPDLRTEVFRKSITSFLEKQGINSDKLSQNEVFLQLEFLAYTMRERKENLISRFEIINRLQMFRASYPSAVIEGWKSPSTFLTLLVNRTGLLFLASKEMDNQGIEKEYFQFFHQSFQDFFAAQAVIHGHSSIGNPGANLQENVLQFVSKLEIESREIPNMGEASLQEPIFAESWQEVAKEMIESLPRALTDELLLNILYPSQVPKQGEGRARAVFAAHMLSKEQDVSPEVANQIISTLVENIRTDIDSKGAGRNTMLDEAMTELAKSSWSGRLKYYLLKYYFELKGLGRSTVGDIISSKIIESEAEFNELNLDYFDDTFSKREKFDDEGQLLYEVLKLMTFAFRRQTYLKKDKSVHVQSIIKKVLSNEQVSEAIRTAIVWAIGWLTQARLTDRKDSINIHEEQIGMLTKLISTPDYDSMAIYWACLSLSCIEDERVYADIDWIYEWAVLADRGKRWSELPEPATAVDRPDIVDPLLAVLDPVFHPIARRGAALALGRLNIFHEKAMDDLLNIIKDASVFHKVKYEAMGYLVQIQSEKVGHHLFKIYQEVGEENETLQSHIFLALLGLGDIFILKKMYIAGENSMGIPGDRIAIIHVLNTHSDDLGREVVQQFQDSADGIEQQAINMGLSKHKDPSVAKADIIIKSLAIEDEDDPLTSEEVAEKTVLILLVNGENMDGRPIFAYVAVRADRFVAFMEAQKSATFYPEDYGVVIESGEGKPSKDVMERMESDYGFDHENQVNI